MRVSQLVKFFTSAVVKFVYAIVHELDVQLPTGLIESHTTNIQPWLRSPVAVTVMGQMI
jgi:hypothetical protein